MMVVFPAAGVASVRLGPGGTNVATEFRAVELGKTPKPWPPNEIKSAVTNSQRTCCGHWFYDYVSMCHAA